MQGSDLIWFDIFRRSSTDKSYATSVAMAQFESSDTGPWVKPRKLIEPWAKQLIALHQSSNCHHITWAKLQRKTEKVRRSFHDQSHTSRLMPYLNLISWKKHMHEISCGTPNPSNRQQSWRASTLHRTMGPMARWHLAFGPPEPWVNLIWNLSIDN